MTQALQDGRICSVPFDPAAQVIGEIKWTEKRVKLSELARQRLKTSDWKGEGTVEYIAPKG